jgi:hypothetical protein
MFPNLLAYVYSEKIYEPILLNITLTSEDKFLMNLFISVSRGVKSTRRLAPISFAETV